MAQETKEVPPTEPPAAEGETKQENGKKQAKKNETPIEELFDLTKPIPRVREPHDFSWYSLCRFSTYQWPAHQIKFVGTMDTLTY